MKSKILVQLKDEVRLQTCFCCFIAYRWFQNLSPLAISGTRIQYCQQPCIAYSIQSLFFMRQLMQLIILLKLRDKSDKKRKCELQQGKAANGYFGLPSHAAN